MIICDLCNEAKECLQKEIEGKEFDICAACWRPLEQKLRGKGRTKKSRDTVLLPPNTIPEREPEEQKPTPGQPPTIFGGMDRPN
jgi:hypothetical protein